MVNVFAQVVAQSIQLILTIIVLLVIDLACNAMELKPTTASVVKIITFLTIMVVVFVIHLRDGT